jgi:septation ring formation regulator EzrA
VEAEGFCSTRTYSEEKNMSLSEGGNNPTITPSLEQLSKTAISLNKASDRLNQAINQLNEALRKLNLGVSSWVTFYSDSDGEGPFSDWSEIGYGKINGKWGIGIRKSFEDLSADEGNQLDSTEWPFSEAPREMRIEAIPFLPKVIEQLNNDAEKTTQILNEKIGDAEKLAEAIEAILDPPRRSVDTRNAGGKQ